MLFMEMEKHTQHIFNSFHLYSKRIDFQNVEVDPRQELHQPISNMDSPTASSESSPQRPLILSWTPFANNYSIVKASCFMDELFLRLDTP